MFGNTKRSLAIGGTALAIGAFGAGLQAESAQASATSEVHTISWNWPPKAVCYNGPNNHRHLRVSPPFRHHGVMYYRVKLEAWSSSRRAWIQPKKTFTYRWATPSHPKGHISTVFTTENIPQLRNYRFWKVKWSVYDIKTKKRATRWFASTLAINGDKTEHKKGYCYFLR